jgi:hypothetical protein
MDVAMQHIMQTGSRPFSKFTSKINISNISALYWNCQVKMSEDVHLKNALKNVLLCLAFIKREACKMSKVTDCDSSNFAELDCLVRMNNQIKIT